MSHILPIRAGCRKVDDTSESTDASVVGCQDRVITLQDLAPLAILDRSMEHPPRRIQHRVPHRRGMAALRPLALAVALALVATAARADGDVRTLRSRGETWSVRIPSTWQAEPAPDDVNYTDVMRVLGVPPAAFLVLIQVARLNAPLYVLESSVRQNLDRQGAAIRDESRAPIGDMAAWRFERTHKQEDGRRLRIVQVLVDGGTRKVVVTVAGPEPLGSEARLQIDALLASLTIASVPAPAPPGPFATRDFPRAGLALPLPPGGRQVDQEDGFQVVWPEHGLLFRAEWHRTTAALKEVLQQDFQDVDIPEEGEATPEVVQTQAVTLPGGAARRARVYGTYAGKRIMTITLLYRASGPGEVVTYGFARFGEVPFAEMAELEACAERAETMPHFAVPAGEPPALADPVEAWGGAAVLRLPRGWTPADSDLPVRGRGPLAAERKRWGTQGAQDLGLVTETGKLEGGFRAFDEWVRRRLVSRRRIPVTPPARTLAVGGRPGFAWEIEHGPVGDRWVSQLVAVVEGGRYYLLLASFPLRLRAAYGGLAENVGTTVEWRGR